MVFPDQTVSQLHQDFVRTSVRGHPTCRTNACSNTDGLNRRHQTSGRITGRYAGCNENFVLVTTGITAVLSFEFPVTSEDGNRLYSKLTTHDSKRQGLAPRRILQSAGIPRAPALGYLALLPAPSPLQSTRLLFVAKMTSWRGPPPKFGFAGRAYSLFPTFFKLPRPVGPKFFRY